MLDHVENQNIGFLMTRVICTGTPIFQLLDCSSVITVFILSYLFLGAGYKLLHLGGAGVCLLGMLGLVLTDVLVGKNTNEGTVGYLY